MRKLLPLLLLSLFSLHGETLLEGDFWLDMDLLGYPYFTEDSWTLPKNPDIVKEEEIHRMILEEIRYTFSAMLYGWEVRYRPAAPEEGVEEYFEIKLRHEIPWGSPQLTLESPLVSGQRFSLHAFYRLTSREDSRRNSALSNRYQDGGGRGTATPYGEIPRIASLEQAVKQSLRNHLQPRTRIRPREITGRVYLREMPYYNNGPDSYTCQIMVKLDLDPLVEYPQNN